MVTEQELKAAEERGKRVAEEVPRGVDVSFDAGRQRVWVKLSNGLELAIAPSLYSFLQDASVEQVSAVELCGAGHELYFPLLDEGIWLPNLYRRMFGATRYHDIMFGNVEGSDVSSIAA